MLCTVVRYHAAECHGGEELLALIRAPSEDRYPLVSIQNVEDGERAVDVQGTMADGVRFDGCVCDRSRYAPDTY